MPTPRTGVLTFLAPPPAQTDAELIGRFVQHRDEAAFAAIVRRHGRAVLGVCRRTLGNSADADDAFQAAFLVLAKKAHRLSFRPDVSAWLFAVAVRASRELLRRRSVRATRETLGAVPDVGTEHEFDSDASRLVLDEVAKLSDSYRSAVVLCELDGVSRADAAKRLGIPEGTLSSRLAAARKQLAVRLSARGVSLALVPFAVGVPAGLAAAVTSDVPSATVSKLTEVLMRTSGPIAAGKWLASLAAAATVVIGLSLGDDPKPQPIRQAAAKVVEEMKPGRLVLVFREEVRYFTPGGQELQQIDYTSARKADPDLISGSITIGTNGITMERFLPTCGRAGPGGVVPLASNGLKLLSPGTPPMLKAVATKEVPEMVVGWEADGKGFVTRTSERSAVWGVTEYKAFRVATATGKREPLPLGPQYEVIDVSADGKWLLAHRHVPRSLGLPGFSADGTEVSLVSRDGKVVYETPHQNSLTAQVKGHRLSPDGSRSAACGRLRAKDADPWQHCLTTYTYPPHGVSATTIHFSVAKPFDAECMAVAWSPDGKQVVSCWRPESWAGKQTWHVVVCDPDGKNVRTVATFEVKNDEQIRSVDWW